MSGLITLAFERLVISGHSSSMFGKFLKVKIVKIHEEFLRRLLLLHDPYKTVVGRQLFFKNNIRCQGYKICVRWTHNT